MATNFGSGFVLVGGNCVRVRVARLRIEIADIGGSKPHVSSHELDAERLFVAECWRGRGDSASILKHAHESR